MTSDIYIILIVRSIIILSVRSKHWELFILDWCNHLKFRIYGYAGKIDHLPCDMYIAGNDTINNPMAHSVLHLISNQNCFAWRMSFAVSTCEIRCGSHAYTWSLLLVFKPRSNPQQPFTQRIFNYLHFKSHLSVFAVNMHKRFKTHLAKKKLFCNLFKLMFWSPLN